VSGGVIRVMVTGLEKRTNFWRMSLMREYS